MSKYKFLFADIRELKNEGLKNVEIARKLISKFKLDENYPLVQEDSWRKFVSKYLSKLEEIQIGKEEYDKLIEGEYQIPNEIESNKINIASIFENGNTLPSFDKYINTQLEQHNKLEYSGAFQHSSNPANVLVIPDLHIPFTEQQDLDHLLYVRKQFNCGKIIFIGDIVDNHYSSFHTPSTKGFGMEIENRLVKEHIRIFSEAFPEATWIIGNHDAIPQRKSVEGRIHPSWLKSYEEYYNVKWKTCQDYIFNGVYYNHGEGTTAVSLAGVKGMPVVQGHQHGQCYIKYLSQQIWGMQVAIAFNPKSWAFEYAKTSVNSWVRGASVVINKTPILIPQ